MGNHVLADQLLTKLWYSCISCVFLSAPRQFDIPACSLCTTSRVGAPPFGALRERQTRREPGTQNHGSP